MEAGPLSRWPGKSSVGSMGLWIGAHATSVSNRPEESLDTTLHTLEASETPGHMECSAPQCLLVPDRGSVGRVPCPGALCVSVWPNIMDTFLSLQEDLLAQFWTLPSRFRGSERVFF